MTHSDTLNELATALAAARLEFAPFVKEQVASLQSAKGTGYSYRYGNLGALFAATTPALSKHGLVLSQWPVVQDGRFVLVTLLVHSSGQWMRGSYPLTVFDRPQEQGSAITYAKRYAAASVLGVAAELDDDGMTATAAAAAVRRPRSPSSPPASAPPSPAIERPLATRPTPRRDDHKPISRAQQKEFFAEARAKGWPTDALKARLYEAFSITSSNDLRVGDFSQALEIVGRGPTPSPAREPGEDDIAF